MMTSFGFLLLPKLRLRPTPAKPASAADVVSSFMVTVV
jgi:hypothetical protein